MWLKKGKPSYEDLQDKIKRLEAKVKLLEGAMDSAGRYIIQWAFEYWVACPLSLKQEDMVIRQVCGGESPGFTKMSEKVLKKEGEIQTIETIWLAPNFLPGYSRYVVRHEVWENEHRNFKAWVLFPC